MGTLAAEVPAATGMVRPNRMAIAILALTGLLVSTYLSLYSFGLIGDIACGAGGCQVVQNSPWAVFLGVPVPLIGWVGYGVLFVVALLGLQPRFENMPAVPLLLIGGAGIGLAFSAYLTYLEAFVIHAWCRWCVVSATLAVVIFLSTLPEIRHLRRPE